MAEMNSWLLGSSNAVTSSELCVLPPKSGRTSCRDAVIDETPSMMMNRRFVCEYKVHL